MILETNMKSPTADVQEAVANLDEQTLINQHKMLKKRTENFAANTRCLRSQKRKKLAEDEFKQESDYLQRGATTQEENAEDPGIQWGEVRSFMQQTQENLRQHARGIKDLKQCTGQLQKDTKMVLMFASGNSETLNEVFDRFETNDPLIKEMHENLSETRKEVEQIKTEQKQMKTLVKELHAAKPNNQQLVDMIWETHEREPAWFTEYKNKQKK